MLSPLDGPGMSGFIKTFSVISHIHPSAVCLSLSVVGGLESVPADTGWEVEYYLDII